MPATSADNSILATGRPVRIPTPDDPSGFPNYYRNFRLTTLDRLRPLSAVGGVWARPAGRSMGERLSSPPNRPLRGPTGKRHDDTARRGGRSLADHRRSPTANSREPCRTRGSRAGRSRQRYSLAMRAINEGFYEWDVATS